MIAVFSKKTGELEQVVYSLDGVKKRGKGTSPAPDGWEETHEWDAGAQRFVKGQFLKEKLAAKRWIDHLAEQQYASVVRGGIIGSQLEPAKRAEAAAFFAASNPNDDDYPLLAAEIGLSGMSVHDIAYTIAAKPAKARSRLIDASLKIEPVRLSARKAIDTAETKRDIADIVNHLIFPDL